MFKKIKLGEKGTNCNRNGVPGQIMAFIHIHSSNLILLSFLFIVVFILYLL